MAESLELKKGSTCSDPDSRLLADVSDLYYKYAKKIRSSMRNRGLSGDLAEDVTQEVFFNLIKYKTNLSDIENMEAWLWTIARNISNSHFRKKETRIDNLSCSDEETYLSIADPKSSSHSDIKEWIDLALDDLEEVDPIRAYALRLITKYDVSIEQLKDYLHKKSNAEASVYSYQSRKKLKRFLETHYQKMEGDSWFS